MKDMTQGSVTRHLLHMASFMAVSMVVQTLYLLADLYWVGRLGKEAIAAVGLSGNLMMVVLALTQMLGVGTTTVISHAAGRKDQASAEVAFNQSVVLSLVVGLLFGVCFFPFRHQYSESLSADAPTAAMAVSYLGWFIPALILQFPLVSLGSALRATGIIKPAVGLQVLSVILNIIFAPLFIFGVGPFPKMGVAGAALATFLSILIANVLTIVYFEKSYRYLRFRASQWRPRFEIWWSMLRIGLPAGAEFADYQRQIVANAAKLAAALTTEGFRLVSGGTDNHLMLVDVFSKGITGKVAEAALGKAGITVNKNAIPFDQNPPMVASGIRIGTPAVTTRGMREGEMDLIGDLIARALKTPDDEAALGMIKTEVERLCRKFPLYPDSRA